MHALISGQALLKKTHAYAVIEHKPEVQRPIEPLIHDSLETTARSIVFFCSSFFASVLLQISLLRAASLFRNVFRTL